MTCKHCGNNVTKDEDRVVFSRRTGNSCGATYHLTCYTAQVTDAMNDLLRDTMLEADK
jgi:hypothetical protein